jgi:hypothetical protein
MMKGDETYRDTATGPVEPVIWRWRYVASKGVRRFPTESEGGRSEDGVRNGLDPERYMRVT